MKTTALCLVHSQHSIRIFSSSIPLLQLIQYLFPEKKKKKPVNVMSSKEAKYSTGHDQMAVFDLIREKMAESKREKQKDRKKEKKKKEKGFQGRR